MNKCPLCGYEFNTTEGEASCQSCPLHSTCNMTRCPNCGYEIPGQSRLLTALKSLTRREDGHR